MVDFRLHIDLLNLGPGELGDLRSQGLDREHQMRDSLPDYPNPRTAQTGRHSTPAARCNRRTCSGSGRSGCSPAAHPG